jgi:hypothetical protein
MAKQFRIYVTGRRSCPSKIFWSSWTKRAGARVRLGVAVDLAREHEAHLIGLCPLDPMMVPATTRIEIAGFAESVVMDFLVKMRAQARERAEPIEARFQSTREDHHKLLLEGLDASGAVELVSLIHQSEHRQSRRSSS